MKILKIKDLEKYGKVVICHEDKLHGFYEILITDGFSSKAINTFELMKLIDESIGDKYNIVNKLITDDNLFHYKLSQPKNK